MKNFFLGFLLTLLAMAIFAIARFLIKRRQLRNREDKNAAAVRLSEEGGGFIGIIKEEKARRRNICSRDDIAEYLEDEDD